MKQMTVFKPGFLAICSMLLLAGTAMAAAIPSRAPDFGLAGPARLDKPTSSIASAAMNVATMALMTPLYASRSAETHYHLKMYHLHSHESIDVTYRVGNRYVPSALAMLDEFLRDDRNGDVMVFDPHEFDVLHALMQKLHRPNGVIDIVCGYRSQETNEYLHDTTRGVAEHSQHMEGKAIDIRVPGVSTRRLDRAALSLEDGGVGYYPRSHFVHVDVGPVRRWTLR
jgi:uncharacterized protein YcbK (DUF882 family)